MTGEALSMHSQDEVRIRQLLAERESAMRAKDAERALADYAPEVVRFDLAPPLQHTGTRDRFVAELRDWFADKEGPFEYEIRDLTVTVGKDVAFCHGLSRMGAPPNDSEEAFELWFRVTVGLRKIDGAWRITHEHESTPFYMDGSSKAALDLRP
jgi:uncharacterized protein (TIGR02246 family)